MNILISGNIMVDETRWVCVVLGDEISRGINKRYFKN